MSEVIGYLTLRRFPDGSLADPVAHTTKEAAQAAVSEGYPGVRYFATVTVPATGTIAAIEDWSCER